MTDDDPTVTEKLHLDLEVSGIDLADLVDGSEVVIEGSDHVVTLRSGDVRVEEKREIAQAVVRWVG